MRATAASPPVVSLRQVPRGLVPHRAKVTAAAIECDWTIDGSKRTVKSEDDRKWEDVMRRRLFLQLGLITLPVLTACQSIDVQQTTTANGVIETVDPASRELLLRGDSGSQSGILLSMVVGPQVQRLSELRSGDHVKVVYYQALAAQMVNVFSSSSQPFEGVSLDRRETAERPGGTVTRVRRGRVVITAVYPSLNAVSFVGPNNMVRTVFPKNPQVQSFIRTLKVGDQVDVVYEEALAISVEPMR
jgi:hypothetical protein